MRLIEKGKKRLKTSKEQLRWVEGQWTEVLAEASKSIAGDPKLQTQLEGKLMKQTNAIYGRLKQTGARPSHAIQPPNQYAEFSERLKHWILEISCFTNEMWDWSVFLEWRRHTNGADTKSQEGQQQASQVPSGSELFEDLVKFRQCEMDKAIGWLDYWRSRVRHYTELEKKVKLRLGASWAAFEGETEEDAFWGEDYNDHIEGQQSKAYVTETEEKVANAAKRLERSKEELQRVLAECAHPSSNEISRQDSKPQIPPTPPETQSPRTLSGDRTLLNNSCVADERYRQLKETTAREGSKQTNQNTEQQTFSSFSEQDDDTEMSDVSEGSKLVGAIEEQKGVEPEDTIMSDVEAPPNHTPSSSPKSSPGPTTGTNSGDSSSPRAHSPIARKTRSSTKSDRPLSGRVAKNIDKKPAKKTEKFTEQQTTALLTASINSPPANHNTSLRRSERLKEKATASTILSPPTQPSQPQPNTAGSSGSPNQKKRKLEPDASEPTQTPGPKKRKIEPEASESEPIETPGQKKPRYSRMTAVFIPSAPSRPKVGLRKSTSRGIQ